MELSMRRCSISKAVTDLMTPLLKKQIPNRSLWNPWILSQYGKFISPFRASLNNERSMRDSVPFHGTEKGHTNSESAIYSLSTSTSSETFLSATELFLRWFWISVAATKNISVVTATPSQADMRTSILGVRTGAYAPILKGKIFSHRRTHGYCFIFIQETHAPNAKKLQMSLLTLIVNPASIW